MSRNRSDQAIRLFKYCPPSEYAIANLANGVLYCRHYQDFNDPFEFWADIVSGVPNPAQRDDRFRAACQEWGYEPPEEDVENTREFFESLEYTQPPFTDMMDDFRICCFGSEADNLLMWSHYADGLRGFCLVFDADEITTGDDDPYLTDVAYLDRPPVVDAFVYAMANDQFEYHRDAVNGGLARANMYIKAPPPSEGELSTFREVAEAAFAHMKLMWQQVFSSKPLPWKYENERRLLLQVCAEGNQPVQRPYPASALRQVVFGERMPLPVRRQIEVIIQQKYPDVEMLTAGRAEADYDITLQPSRMP